MGITRTTLLGGPAAATFDGHTFFARDGILVTPALEADLDDGAGAEVDSDAMGAIDRTMPGAVVMIQFTPSAPWCDLQALYPWTQDAPGTPLFGTADVPLVLVAANGVRLTFAAAAVWRMPDLLLGGHEPVAGAVTFLALGARSLGLTAANRVVTIDTAAVPLAPAGSPQMADDFVITWGAAPWVNLRSREGVRVRFAMATRPVFSDANGLLDLTLEKLAVTASFTPASPGGPAEADLVAALQWQGANASPGRPLSQTGESLTIAGGEFSVELPLANVVSGGLAFDVERPRLNELMFVAERAFLNVAEPMVILSEG